MLKMQKTENNVRARRNSQMAIYHATCKPISRGAGHSSTAKAAYIGCKQITDERTSEKFNYNKKQGFLGGDIILPDCIDLKISSSKLWNMAEAAERRCDSRVGREWEISLPCELTQEQRQALAIDFTRQIANLYGVACEYALHAPSKNGDERNYHVHILTTTRKINADGLLGEKSDIELDNKLTALHKLPTTQQQILKMRKLIAEITNRHLELANLEERVSHLSYEDQGIDKVAGVHKGKAVTEMERRGIKTDVLEIDKNRQEINQLMLGLKTQIFDDGAELSSLQKELYKLGVEAKLELNNGGEISQLLNKNQVNKILEAIEYHDAVFTDKTLSNYLKHSFDNYRLLEHSIGEVKQAKNVISLGFGDDGYERYTTSNMLGVEREIQDNVGKFKRSSFEVIDEKKVVTAIGNYETITGKKLTEEQNNAVMHIIGNERISCIVGRAGTGKSFSLASAKAIWDSNGNTVYGIAVSGIATSGLSKDANINSRTVASFLLSADGGYLKLDNKSIVVMDEAGMTDSISMQKVTSVVEKSGAKLVLVGDPAQLQPVGPGASFRAILEKTGFAEIQTVYRQKEDWQRQATVDFSQANTGAAIQSYYNNNCVQLMATNDIAMQTLANDWQSLRNETGKDISKFLVVAHRNVDVRYLNELLRQIRVNNKEIADGYEVTNIVAGKARETKIALNDRIIFLKNDKALGVSNGRFATVSYVNFSESGKVVSFDVKLDGSDEYITIDPSKYSDFDYGYAATVHKTQGVTVDHSFVYGGGNLNSSLTYVAMTRHRDSTCLYASKEQYADIEALKARVSRLDVKDSVLNYLDEVDDYAARRGIETNQTTLKQILVDSLRAAKDRIVGLFTGQQHSFVAQTMGDVESGQAIVVVSTKECAKVVAAYVQANNDFISVYSELKVKLAELGFEKVSYEAEDYAVISKMPEYKEMVKLSDIRSDSAHTVLANLEESSVALGLNKVDIEKLQKYATEHEIKLRVEGYANAAKLGLPERYKLAYEIMKDVPEHYAKLKINGVDIEQVKLDMQQWIFERIKINRDAAKFVTFDSAVRGYLELQIQRLRIERELNSDNEAVLNIELAKICDELKTYTQQFDKTYGDELSKCGGADKEISINKNGGFMETYSRCLENTLTAEDMSGIARHLAQQRLEDFIKPRIEYFKAYKEIQPLRDECKKVNAKFELTPEYVAYLKIKTAFEAAGAKIHTEFKNYERVLNVIGIKQLEIEQCAEYLPRSQSFQLAVDYRSIKDDTSREAYELAYKLTGDSRNYYAVQHFEIDNNKLQLRSQEILVAYALKRAGVEPLASQLPGAAYIDIVDTAKVSLSEQQDDKLQSLMIEYFETDIVQSRAFRAQLCATEKEVVNHYSKAMFDAKDKAGKLQHKFKNSELVKLISTKYDASKYTFSQAAVLNGGDIAAYQRALLGRSTSEDFAVVSDKLSQQRSLSQSQSMGRSMRR